MTDPKCKWTGTEAGRPVGRPGQKQGDQLGDYSVSQEMIVPNIRGDGE